MTIPFTIALMLMGGDLRVERRATTTNGESCPLVCDPDEDLLSKVSQARTRALRPTVFHPKTDVMVTLVDCLPQGQAALSTKREIWLSIDDLESAARNYSEANDAVVDYVAFILAHEADHVRQQNFDSCASLGAEFEADRAAAQRSNQGRAVLGDILQKKFDEFVDSEDADDVTKRASTCVNLLETSTRLYDLASYLATGERAHQYYESNEQMHTAVNEAYRFRELAFDALLTSCRAAVREAGSSCHERRLADLEAYRRVEVAGPPQSWQDWDVPRPWPRFAQVKVAASGGAGYGVYWMEPEVGQPREAWTGPRAELRLFRPRPKPRGRVGTDPGFGGHVSYQALLRSGEAPMHRLTVGLGIDSMASRGKLAGGPSLWAGWSQDFRPDADVGGLAIGAGVAGAARLRRQLDVVIRVHYETVIGLASRSDARIGAQGRGYSHGVDASVSLATYFGVK